MTGRSTGQCCGPGRSSTLGYRTGTTRGSGTPMQVGRLHSHSPPTSPLTLFFAAGTHFSRMAGCWWWAEAEMERSLLIPLMAGGLTQSLRDGIGLPETAAPATVT